MGNTIRSSRYTAWNFLPRQLFAQFSKLANFYFLCVSILQMIPNLSTTGTYTTIVPLLFFVSVSIAKEGYDDLRRYRLDKAENNRDAKVLHAYQPTSTTPSDAETVPSPSVRPLHWSTTKWKDIRVGDVIKLSRNEAAPADLVLLHSSGDNGIAYVETMALDGETNLKSKQATASLAKMCKTPDSIALCKAQFVVEDPNLDLYTLEGRVTVDGETSPLTNTEVINRGSVLRNTPDAIGMVIYSGEECRIRMNANKNPRIKAPALQAIVNRVVIVIVIFVIALAIFNTVAYQIWSDSTEDNSWYLTNAGVAFFPILASFIIMFNTMIPLSLYVSLEIIKLAQMFLLNDIDMYDEVSDTPFEARTSTINEELGQIRYDAFQFSVIHDS
jgi:phospholipid-translocating ATPase